MSKTALYALGGLIAAEAVGVINLTGGESDGERGSQPIINIPDRGSGGISSGTLAGLIGQDSGGIDAGTVAALMSGSKSPSEIVIESGVSSGQERVDELVGTLEEQYEKKKEQVKDETTGDFGGSLWDADINADPKNNDDTLGRTAGRTATHTLFTGPAEGSLNELERFGEEAVLSRAEEGIDTAVDTGSTAVDTSIDTRVKAGKTLADTGQDAKSFVEDTAKAWVDQETQDAKELGEMVIDTPITGGSTGARLIK